MINHYVSTYKKDYTWPRKLEEQPPTEIAKACACPDSRQVIKELVVTSLGESFDWSRMGPMGRLSEPKVYRAKIELIPEADPTQFDQPHIHLEELLKCTDLDGMIEKPLSDEINARVEADRLKTTYQADYSDPAYVRMVRERDKPPTIDDTDCQKLKCRPIKIILEHDCPPLCLPSLKDSYNGNASWKQDLKRKIGLKHDMKCCKNVNGRKTQFTPWKSEYQDSISKIGQVIMKTKLHDKKQRTVPVLAISH